MNLMLDKANKEALVTADLQLKDIDVVREDDKSQTQVTYEFRFDNDLNKIEQDYINNEYESLKLEHETLLKEHKKMKKDYNKLNANYTKLKEEDSQISFGNITPNNEVLDELLNLDILNMNLIDCVNTLYILQKKAKENR